MCIANVEPMRDAIQIAIDGVIRRHPGISLNFDLDPVDVACRACDGAVNCADSQSGIAALLVLQAEVIRRQREQIRMMAQTWYVA